MRTVFELIEATHNNGGSLQYWYDLHAEIDEFWNHPDTTDAQRTLLRKEGYLEMIGMLCADEPVIE